MKRFFALTFLSGLLIVLSAPVIADDKDNENTDLLEVVSPDLNENAAPQVDVQSEDSSGSTKVTNDELKKLEDARKAKSDAAIVKAVSEILSRDPINLIALNTLGVYYFETRKFGLAKTIFKRALKDHPKEPALHNNLGIIYLAQNELQLALESLKNSVTLRADYQMGAVNLSSIYLEYKDYQKSLMTLEDAYRALRSDLRRGTYESLQVANNYAIALMGIGENDKAGEVFSDINKAGTRDITVNLNYLIFLVEVQKNKKEATRQLTKLKIVTDDQDILRRANDLVSKLEKN